MELDNSFWWFSKVCILCRVFVVSVVFFWVKKLFPNVIIICEILVVLNSKPFVIVFVLVNIKT